MKSSHLLTLAVMAALTRFAAAAPITVESGDLAIACDPDTQELTFSKAGKPFVEHVKWWDGLGEIATGKTVDVTTPLGKGKGIQIDGGQGSETFWLVEGTPFVLARVTLKADANTPIKDIVPFTAPLTTAPQKFFSPEGNTNPGKYSTYFFLAAVNPQTRAGTVTGWITHETGSGIVDAKSENSQMTLAPRGEYGNRPLAGQSLESEIAAIGTFDDARLGLEALADANAKQNQIQLKPPPSGYCTWYHARASNEKDLKALADFAKKANLNDYGFSFVQIDDGWQTARRDFSDYKHDGPYRAGMKQTADNITADGYTAGIWLTPFAWDSKIMADKLDLFAKTADGKAYEVKWAGDCLDMTNPAAQKYLSDTVHKITHDWGYKYLKVDGLWSGTATTILYPNPAYKPDDYGGAQFHDKSATNLAAYRTGLRVLRKAAGDDVFINGCNVAQNHRTLGGSIGLLDAMRVGPDITARWDNIAGRAAVFATREYFLNGKVWWNDPDCLMLRDPITVDQGRAWGSFIALSGQLNIVSEDLSKLPAEKLDIIKRTMPAVPHAARPLDLFEKNQPQIWQAKVGSGETEHMLIGLFNWDEKADSTLKTDPASLGLDSNDYIAFDYWDNQFVKLAPQTSVKPGSCKIISLVKNQNRPQVVSTSRHILQGAPDLVEVTWDPATNTLKGKSKVIANDPYEIRIATGPYTFNGVTSSQPNDFENKNDGHVRVKIDSKQTTEVTWQIKFNPR